MIELIKSIPAEKLNALIALVAVVVGPIVTIYTLRRQIRAEVVLKNRKTWIDLLTDEIALFYKAMQETTFPTSVNIKDQIAEAKYRLARVRLVIKPTDVNHQELCSLLKEAIDTASQTSNEGHTGKMENILEQIVKKSSKS
jgi:hypothetical protein